MTIQNLERFVDSLWDWGILKGCFGNTKIEPTDIDGLVERNGHFLLLEAKRPGVKVKQGQLWTFNALRNTGLFTILLLWGEKNLPQQMQVFYPKPYEVSAMKHCDIDDVRRVVRWWFERAERLKQRHEARSASCSEA